MDILKRINEEAEYKVGDFEPNDETALIISENKELLSRFYEAENNLESPKVENLSEKLFWYYLEDVETSKSDYMTWDEITMLYSGFHKSVIGYINHQKMCEDIEEKQTDEAKKNKIIVETLIKYSKELSASKAKPKEADTINKAITDLDTIPESATKVLLSGIELVIAKIHNPTGIKE